MKPVRMSKANIKVVIITIISIIFSACWSPKDANTDSKSTPPAPSPSEMRTPMPENKSGQNTDKNTSASSSGGFKSNMPAGFETPTDDVGQKLLKEYGAMFVARGGATPPTVVAFKDAADVSSFQSKLKIGRGNIGGFSLELQEAAMNALNDAIAEAAKSNLKITPRGGDSARRSYEDTVTLWASRVEPALKHWVDAGKLPQSEASRIKGLSPYQQVPEVFKLESQGMFFAKDLSKSIIYSVAPPGTSQHLSMLALDVSEFGDAKVREILAKHYWYQTVVSDLPHFTFLGVPETELPGLGLKKTSDGGRTFWVPNI